MFTVFVIIAIIGFPALVILSEVRIGRLRWLMAETNLRITALEKQVSALASQIAAFRSGAPEAPSQSAPVPPPAATPQRPAEPTATEPPPAGLTPEPSPPRPSVPVVRPTPPQPAAIAPVAPASNPPSLEERLGTRWAVWVGGLALALGGLLLVRYSIEQGYFGPAARIVMGLLMAAALIGGGEWFRRSGPTPALQALPQAHIPSILTATGSLTLFGTIYAAYALYEFIGPAIAFVLLGAVGVLTMFAAALHGPLLAGLGLAASYGAPLLVSSSKPSPWPLVVYLGVVAASAFGLARVRAWLWLAAVAVAGAFVWGFIFLKPISAGAWDWTLGGYLHTVIQLSLAAVVFAVLTHAATRDHEAEPDPISSFAIAALALLAVLMLAAGRYDLASAVPFTLAIAAVLCATAWIAPRTASATLLAGFVILTSTAVWPGLKTTIDTSHLLREVAGILLVPENVVSYLMFAALASLAITAVATLRLVRGQTLPPSTAGIYALAATATPLLTLIIAYLRVTQFDRSISFAAAAAALALLFAVLTERFQRREIPELHGTQLVTGAFASASIAALAFGLVAFLSRGYLTVALALAATGTAYVAVARNIPLLRHVVTALAAVVLARIAYDPRIMGDEVGTLPILNWLLIGYGAPAAAFFTAARLIESRGAHASSRIADATAVLLAALLGFFQIHHALNDGDPFAPAASHIELGLMAVLCLGLAWASMRLDLGRANPVFRWASIGFGVLSGFMTLAGLGIHHNPLVSGEIVKGPPVASSLVLGYLLPGLGAVLLARAARPWRPRWYVTSLAVMTLALLFGYLTLEIRHAFQGERIHFLQTTSAAEWWSYSAGWLWLGLVFLAYGIFRGSIEARLASAVLVLMAVVKAFLFDLAGLSGFWRALSFIVLGVVLIGIGLVYQHLVFGQRRITPQAPQPPAPTPT